MKAMHKRLIQFGSTISLTLILGGTAFAEGHQVGDIISNEPGAGAGPDGAPIGQGIGEALSSEPARSLTNPLTATSVTDVVSTVYNFLFGISIALVVVFVLVGAYQLMTSGGNPEKVTQGRNTIIWALIGFAVVIVAGGAASIVGDILGVKEPVGTLGTSTPIETTRDIVNVIMNVARWMFGILMALGIVFVLYSAFLYLVSGGDPEKISTARRVLTYAVIAMVVGVLAGGSSMLIRNIFTTSSTSESTYNVCESDCARLGDADDIQSCLANCN